MFLRKTSLTTRGIAILASKGSEHLGHLDLSENQLDEAAVQQLIQGRWLKLMMLSLNDNNLNDAAIEILAEGQWPQLQFLSVQRNCVTFHGLQHLPAAHWPCTKTLVITSINNQIAAQSDILQGCDASVHTLFDTDYIVFTTDKHGTEHVSFDICTSRLKNALL